ncbi:small integral membrane protein 35 isoform X2 [Amblyraja radiata]|uniref:small integral membrane protein 35 isoform X2 n=1 Tax=Amblyraja radiata TaxID=386614 RepID=UPI0014024483|nr:small integral membrane protein 35 isoform X2 [Amblyraja radiata]
MLRWLQSHGEIMDHPYRKLTTVVPSDGGVNTRGIIIAVCLLLLTIVSLAALFILYHRRGHSFKRPKMNFRRNILRELNAIQLEFHPPFTVSGMMNSVGNRSSDHQFQYRNTKGGGWGHNGTEEDEP